MAAEKLLPRPRRHRINDKFLSIFPVQFCMIENHNKLFLVLLFIFVSINPLSAEEKPDPLENFLKNFESYQAGFKQVLSNEHGAELESSNGVVYIQKPGKFRWVYEEPYKQVIITDSKTLWLYDEDLAQVTIKDITESIENTPAAIISGQVDINEYFVLVDMGNIEGYDWVELTPRDTESQYTSVRLGFDKDNLGMMILFDNLGQVTRIDFLNPERNKRFGGPLFTFEIPEGVDIVDERQQEKPDTAQ